MINILSQNGKIAHGIINYTLDDMSDFDSLPTNIATGSTAYVIANGKEYVINSKGEWKIKTTTNGNTSTGLEVSEEMINEMVEAYLGEHPCEGITSEEVSEILKEYATKELLKDYVLKSELAAEKVVTVGEKSYTSFKDAISETVTGTIKLADEISFGEQLVLEDGQDITIDLNGHNISADPGTNIAGGLISVKRGATLTINGQGKIIGESAGGLVYAGIALTSADDVGDSKPATLIINSGEVSGSYYGIAGNGNRGNTKIVVNGGVVKGLVSTDCTGIYNPQPNSSIEINGGVVEGTTGIEIRAGKLSINGGTISGSGVPLKVTPNGNGTTSIGAGVAIAQHNTKQPIDVQIKDGVLKGFVPLYESNPQKNAAEFIDLINLDVTGGSLICINGGTVPVYSEDKEKFVGSKVACVPTIDTKYLK